MSVYNVTVYLDNTNTRRYLNLDKQKTDEIFRECRFNKQRVEIEVVEDSVPLAPEPIKTVIKPY